MSPALGIFDDGKRFMWDGHVCATSEEASKVKETYQTDNFEVRVVDDANGFLVYTRRAVKSPAATVQ